MKENTCTTLRGDCGYLDLDEFLDCFVLVHRCTFLDKINLVLQNNDVLQTHNFSCCKMLRCLRLRVAFIHCYQQQCSIHDSSSIKHCSHEKVMPLFKDTNIVET